MQRLINFPYSIYIIAAGISLLISFWINTHTIILNPDAICYLQSAQTIHDQGLSAGMSLCGQSKWPFYSLFIAAGVKLTTLSYEQFAIVLNSLFSMLTVLIFIRIVSLFTNKKSIYWFAAFVSLLFHEWNGVKPDIIRDHGFWFFYLLSIFFLIRYVQHKKWSDSLIWGGSVAIAMLFRIEAAIFLLFLPFFVLFENKEKYSVRCRSFLHLNSVLIIGLVILFSVSIFFPNIPLSRINELRLHLQISELHSTLIKPFLSVANWLGDTLFVHDPHNKYILYFFTLVVWYVSLV
ncbi:MAG: glycosyltransferase family 39 protein, partial [Gammaproteobacteria bacterium]|nr:glycosyltransferase family 39 protein [Gammaproteobacteria bacterium]